MSKDKMIQARELIKQQRYDDARALLVTIEHPLARRWLDKLDEIAARSGAGLKQQMQTARNLIVAKDYAQARALLQQVDHPTARKWLAKLDEIAPETAAPPADPAPEQVSAPGPADAPDTTGVPDTAPVAAVQPVPPTQAATESPASEQPAPAPDQTPPAPASAAEPVDATRAAQEQRLVAAQELILSSKFEEAQALLDDIMLPEAIVWRNKTQMNKFREFQSLWLDLYYYDVPDSADPAGWTCPECGRDREQARQCPQQGRKPCPLVIKEHALDEPNRLALVLGSIYMEQTGSIKTMLKDVDAARLAQWRGHLERQLSATWEQDIRRPALETAIMLLHQLEQTRLLQGLG